MTGLYSSNYPDSTSSLIQTSPQVLNQTWTSADMLNTNSSSGFNPKAPYQISIPDQVISNVVVSTMNNYPSNAISFPTNCALMGFQKPFAPEFSRGTN